MSTDFKSVVNSIKDLPPMPAVAVKVLELLNDPNVNYERLGEVISSDPAVSAADSAPSLSQPGRSGGGGNIRQTRELPANRCVQGPRRYQLHGPAFA